MREQYDSKWKAAELQYDELTSQMSEQNDLVKQELHFDLRIKDGRIRELQKSLDQMCRKSQGEREELVRLQSVIESKDAALRGLRKVPATSLQNQAGPPGGGDSISFS